MNRILTDFISLHFLESKPWHVMPWCGFSVCFACFSSSLWALSCLMIVTKTQAPTGPEETGGLGGWSSPRLSFCVSLEPALHFGCCWLHGGWCLENRHWPFPSVLCHRALQEDRGGTSRRWAGHFKMYHCHDMRIGQGLGCQCSMPTLCGWALI